MDWLAGVYVNAMNVIHYMHDKYAYERVEMALHDYAPLRTMAFGMAGMSVVADSLSAIRYAKVRVVRDETGLITDYQTEGTFPVFGNNDNRVDQIAVWLVSTFMSKLRKHPTYRNALHTQSILTITSNVVYGKATGNTPDGRRRGEPFAPGANPMHGRDSHGIHAAAASVAKIPYRDAADGISLTATLVPTGLGRVAEDRITNLTAILDAVLRQHRLPHERQRAEPRHAARCHGPSGEVSEPDDSRLRLCRQFRPAHPRAADGRHQSYVPWRSAMRTDHTVPAALSLRSLGRSALTQAGCAVAIVALCAGPAFGADRQIVRPKGTAPGGNFSPGILIDGTLYISGQAGEDKDGKVSGSFEAEVKQALDNIGVVLDAAGMSPADVVSVQVYLTDGALFQRMNTVYTSYFKDPRPTRTTVVVAKLVGPGHIEITATAKK